MAQRVAILGLGTMGIGMAKNLLKAGFPLTVYNRTRSKAEPLADLGATIADTPKDAARDADVILSMLADDSASRLVWTGDKGAISGAKPGAVLVESSTVTPEWIAELRELATAHKLELLDAPVTGSRVQADAGQLILPDRRRRGGPRKRPFRARSNEQRCSPARSIRERSANEADQ